MNAENALLSAGSPRRWTDQQLDAIRSVGSGLLVSAAAGSGKTSVLAERCAYLVCDARPRCSVSQLLVVTFTEAAAAEMKARIDQTLRARLAAAPDDVHLRRQLALMEQANISTIHSFCHRLLKQHFHRLGLDPAFRVLDGDEAALLRAEVVHELFAERYDRPDAADFCELIDAYGDGADDRVAQVIVRLHEILSSLPHPGAWMQRSLERIDQAIHRPMDESELGRALVALVADELNDILRECRQMPQALRRLSLHAQYGAWVRNLEAIAGRWADALAQRGYDGLVNEVAATEFESLPGVSRSLASAEVARQMLTDLRDRLKGGDILSSLRFSQAQWQQGLRHIRGHLRLVLELVEEFSRRYRRAKDQAVAQDFADLEHYALKLLREGDGPALTPSAVARSLHRQFQHVLVDEYQDINELQDAILALVSRECLADAGSAGRTASNLFCVGDVKQSIYAFRMADAGRFLDRQRRFRADAAAGRVIDLQANFRSRAPLLEALNALFARLMTRDAAQIEYDQSQHLRPGAHFPEDPRQGAFVGAPIELHVLPAKIDDLVRDTDDNELAELERGEREALMIARRIDELMGCGGRPRARVYDAAAGGYRDIEYRDIVILLRAMRFHADRYASILRRCGLPVHAAAGAGFFNCVEVRDILSLLRLLDNQRQDIPLAAVLRSPLAGLKCPEDALARIRLACNDSRMPPPFHEAALRYARERDDDLAAALRAFFQRLSRWRDAAHQLPIPDLIWQIYQESGYLAFCSGLEGGPQRCANLLRLHERARQFGAFLRQGLYRFVRFMEDLGEQSEAPEAADLSEADDVVRIMSVHRAKGLEFPVVIVPELGKAINFASSNGAILADRRAGLGLLAVDLQRRIRYPTLASSIVRQAIRRSTIAEELRILYVAMTRAREHLILVGSAPEKKLERWQQLWTGHQGPLPTATVVGARTPLDWLGPVAAALKTVNPLPLELRAYTSGDLALWTQELGQRRAAAAVPAELAQLRPLDPPPPMHPDAATVIQRLSWKYPHSAVARLEASRPVTSWTHDQRSAPHADATSHSSATAQSLELPRCLIAQRATTAAERGSAVHLFLEHLDFASPCDDAGLSWQLEALVSRRIMSPQQAAATDLATVRWFLNTPLGQLLRRKAGELLRELPVVWPLDPSRVDPAAHSDDPADRVMVRGRIDLLVPEGEAFVLVDYKTDAVSAAQIAARCELYRPQLELYREAIGCIIGRPVSSAHLVFLTPREVRRVL